MNDHIHTADDGRGPRRVFVDGREIKRVMVADIARGVVRQHVGVRGRRSAMLFRAVRGVVTVEQMDG